MCTLHCIQWLVLMRKRGTRMGVCVAEATIIVVIYIQAVQNARIQETHSKTGFAIFHGLCTVRPPFDRRLCVCVCVCISAIMQNGWLVGTKQWGRIFTTKREHEHRPLTHRRVRCKTRMEMDGENNKNKYAGTRRRATTIACDGVSTHDELKR